MVFLVSNNQMKSMFRIWCAAIQRVGPKGRQLHLPVQRPGSFDVFLACFYAAQKISWIFSAFDVQIGRKYSCCTSSVNLKEKKNIYRYIHIYIYTVYLRISKDQKFMAGYETVSVGWVRNQIEVRDGFSVKYFV